MAFKRYINKGGKKTGPYYYENVRTADGKVKTVYLGAHSKAKQESNKLFSLFLIILFLIILLGVSLFFSRQDLSLPTAHSEKTFEIDQQLIKVLLKEGESMTRPVRIMNSGSEETTFKISSIGLGDLVQISTPEFSLKPGQTQILDLGFVSEFPERKILYNPDVYVGKITVETNTQSGEIPVVIEIESDRVLFDMNLNMPANQRQVMQGQATTAEITIFNLQLQTPANVRMEYAVKDLEGNVILTESETVVLETRASFFKTFKIPENIATGTYVFQSKAEYGNSVGTSTYTFDVIGPETETAGDFKVGAICSTEDPLCWISLLVIVLLIFFIGAYAYFFIGAYVFEKVNRDILRKRTPKEISTGTQPPAKKWPYYIVIGAVFLLIITVLHRRGFLTIAQEKISSIQQTMPPILSDVILIILAALVISLIVHYFIKNSVFISKKLTELKSKFTKRKKQLEKIKSQEISKKQQEQIKIKILQSRRRNALNKIFSTLTPIQPARKLIKITKQRIHLFKLKIKKLKLAPLKERITSWKRSIRRRYLLYKQTKEQEAIKQKRKAERLRSARNKKIKIILSKITLPAKKLFNKIKLSKIKGKKFKLAPIKKFFSKFKLPKIKGKKFKLAPIKIPENKMPIPQIGKKKPFKWPKIPKFKLILQIKKKYTGMTNGVKKQYTDATKKYKGRIGDLKNKITRWNEQREQKIRKQKQDQKKIEDTNQTNILKQQQIRADNLRKQAILNQKREEELKKIRKEKLQKLLSKIKPSAIISRSQTKISEKLHHLKNRIKKKRTIAIKQDIEDQRRILAELNEKKKDIISPKRKNKLSTYFKGVTKSLGNFGRLIRKIKFKKVPKAIEKEVMNHIKIKPKIIPRKPIKKPELLKPIKKSLLNMGKAFKDSGKEIKIWTKNVFKRKKHIVKAPKAIKKKLKLPTLKILPKIKFPKFKPQKLIHRISAKITKITNALKKVRANVKYKKQLKKKEKKQLPPKVERTKKKTTNKTIFAVLHNLGLVKTPEETERIKQQKKQETEEEERNKFTINEINRRMKSVKILVKQSQFTLAEKKYKDVVKLFRSLPIKYQIKLKPKIIKKYGKILKLRERMMKQ